MIVHDNWWSNGSARSTIIDYHEPFDQGLRDFPEAKLNSEKNVYGDLYFLLHNNNVYVILFNLNLFTKVYQKEKNDIAERVDKTMTLRTLYVHVVLNGFFHKFNMILFYRFETLSVKFSPNYFFKTLGTLRCGTARL